jgi:hypothetical protein
MLGAIPVNTEPVTLALSVNYSDERRRLVEMTKVEDGK